MKKQEAGNKRNIQKTKDKRQETMNMKRSKESRHERQFKK